MGTPVRAALVVAAHEFDDPTFAQLRSPAQDVDALAGVLADPAIGGFDVRTVVNQPAAMVQQELERFFSDRVPEDLLLLYFSCHGVKDPTGRLYFATSDTTFDLLRSTGVSATFVSEQMEYSRSKRIVVLLDCCYSGAFLKGFRARGDATVAVDELEGRGRAVITASRATEYAFEADEMTADHPRPSLFTGAIVDGLQTGKADRNHDGRITVDELYDYVYDSVRDRIVGQTPGRWVDVEGDLVVARAAVSVAPEVPAVAVADPPAEPDPGPVAGGGPDVSVGPVVSATDDAEPAPGLDVPTTPGDRWAGRLAAAGGVLVLLAPYFVFLRYDGWSESLRDRAWFSEGSIVLFGLAGFAALDIVGTRRPGRVGPVVLAAMAPVALGQALTAAAEAVHADGGVGLGPGWVLHELGLGLLVVAGVITGSRWVRLVARSRPTSDESLRTGTRRVGGFGWTLALPAAALAVGLFTALGWARVFDSSSGGWFGASRPTTDLAVGLTTVIAGSVLVGGRLRRKGVTPRLAGTIEALLVGAIVVRYASTDGVFASGYWLWSAAFTVLAVGAVIVPSVATSLTASRDGAVLLGSWMLASAAWVPATLASGWRAGVLGLAMIGAAALAATMGILSRGPVSTTPPSTRWRPTGRFGAVGKGTVGAGPSVS